MTEDDLDLAGKHSASPSEASSSSWLWTEPSPAESRQIAAALDDSAVPARPALRMGGIRLPRLGRGRLRGSRREQPGSPVSPVLTEGLAEPVKDRTRRRASFARLAAAFAFGAGGTLLLSTSVALGVSSASPDKALPGVSVGWVDVSGLTRAEIMARLQSACSYLGDGQVTIVTPTGTGTMSYQEAGRRPDVELMADEALSAGRSDNPLIGAAGFYRGAIAGQNVPIAVRVDPEAVAKKVRSLTSSSRLLASDAEAMLFYGKFVAFPSRPGTAIDEVEVSKAIVANLSSPDAPQEFRVGEALVSLKPRVSNADAAAAIAAAERMVVDIALTFPLPAGPVITPKPSATPTPSEKTYPLSADVVRSWITFGMDDKGTYGPRVDLGKVEEYLSKLSGRVLVAPVEPKVVFGKDGNPSSLAGGKDGTGMDVPGTAKLIGDYLVSLAGGASRKATLAAAVGPVPPKITASNLTGLTVLGAWTTLYYPGITNGNGVNISLPAKILNGQIVAPGAVFSFLARVGPIDRAHGFTSGGVIVKGKSDHTGAIGGGICSASTTVFNAAAWAGLKIIERHAHAYYIDRYPVGLDSTVYSNGVSTYDSRWVNDTPNPIIIQSWTARRPGASAITVKLWSLPTGRKVTFTPAFKANLSRAKVITQYVVSPEVPPGTKVWNEFPSDGYDTSRTRTVTDSSGQVLYTDTWVSHYKRVDGIYQIGVAAAPTPTIFLPLFGLLPLLRALRPRRTSGAPGVA